MLANEIPHFIILGNSPSLINNHPCLYSTYLIYRIYLVGNSYKVNVFFKERT